MRTKWDRQGCLLSILQQPIFLATDYLEILKHFKILLPIQYDQYNNENFQKGLGGAMPGGGCFTRFTLFLAKYQMPMRSMTTRIPAST